MRYANLSGRLVVIAPDGTAVDVATASGERFSAAPQAVYDHWDEFVAWAASQTFAGGAVVDLADLDAPVPTPRQLFAIGLNYRSHASEVGLAANDVPPVFTKFVSSLTGPSGSVVHPGGNVDWEVELVVVLARGGRNIAPEDAWTHVAGVTAGQDLSERETQHAGLMPQFSLGKSFPGFSPMGPWVVTPDELPDRDDLELECRLNGEIVQKARTSEMILSVSELLVTLSRIVTLLPGDVIYTGTPAGVGMGRTPPQYVTVGDELVTTIGGIGTLRQTFVAPGA